MKYLSILNLFGKQLGLLLFDKDFTSSLKSVQEAVEVWKTFQNKITINWMKFLENSTNSTQIHTHIEEIVCLNNDFIQE